MPSHNTKFAFFHLSRALRTRELIHECAELAPPDDYGRRLPAYIVVHNAMEEYRDRALKKQKGAKA